MNDEIIFIPPLLTGGGQGEGGAGSSSTEQLKDAFLSFNETSERLEQAYQIMASRTEALQSVLEERDGREREGRLESLGWIVAKIVHEVRNPLGSIELITSLLRRS